MKSNDLYEFFEHLDRSRFIEGDYKQFAHYDNALPIGYKQTISQPSMVYEMTLTLELTRKHKVLEIGTGSGYQTAFLAEFGGHVFTVERIKELSWKAVQRLMDLGYSNVNFKIGDGSDGWEEFAPYDRIIVTAAPVDIPENLIAQLKNGGRMIIPVGEKGKQELVLLTKDEKGKVSKEFLGEVAFVELKGDFGWKQ